MKKQERQDGAVHVIIVEDNFVLADSLRMFLNSCNSFVVEIAGNVSSALELIDRTAFDVAILDIRLGTDTVTKVARRIQGAEIPIIYLSGYADAGLLPEDLRTHTYLAKPCPPEELLATIRNLLARPA